jgi:hypothetical protein
MGGGGIPWLLACYTHNCIFGKSSAVPETSCRPAGKNHAPKTRHFTCHVIPPNAAGNKKSFHGVENSFSGGNNPTVYRNHPFVEVNIPSVEVNNPIVYFNNSFSDVNNSIAYLNNSFSEVNNSIVYRNKRIAGVHNPAAEVHISPADAGILFAEERSSTVKEILISDETKKLYI